MFSFPLYVKDKVRLQRKHTTLCFSSNKEKLNTQITFRVYPELWTDLFHSIPSLPFLCSDINFAGVKSDENEVLRKYFQYTKLVRPEAHRGKKKSNQKKIEACSFLNNLIWLVTELTGIFHILSILFNWYFA